VAGSVTSPSDREELVFPGEGMCFGCSPRNAAGLQLRFFRDGDGVRCETTVAAAYQGAPEIVHGGIQAVLLDETCCAAAFFTRGGFVLTGQLHLKYRRPCHTGRPLVVTARIIAQEERFLRIAGEIREGSDDEPVTTAEGKFYPNPARA
jgi:acyl-coenzyme A thioesterase PaaI-like protein